MALLSEKKLSNKIRIQLIEHIAEIDLPWFLFLEIDAALSMLNYFKLSNLQRNEAMFLTYLDEVAVEYSTMIEELAKRPQYHRHPWTESSWFLTDSLIMKSIKINLTQQQLIGIESVYRVKSLLRMKEFINRRIYNQHTDVGLSKKKVVKRKKK